MNGFVNKMMDRGVDVVKAAGIGSALRIKNALDKTVEKAPGNELRPDTEQKNARILVVEDNIINQRVICAMLERAGYNAEVKSDGVSAIKELESSAYDLVLMDCSMPIMDGFSAARAIRAAGSHVLDRNIPIIAVTSLAMKEDEKKCLQAGMNHYVSKPIVPAILLGKIDQSLAAGVPNLQTAANNNSIAASPMNEQNAQNPDNPEASTDYELDSEFLESMIELFLEDAPNKIARIEAAVQNKDCDQLLAISHKIRGSSAVLGIHEITRLALAVEKTGNFEGFEKAAGIALNLVLEMKKFLANLTEPDVQGAI